MGIVCKTISLAFESGLRTVIGEVASGHAYECSREEQLSAIEKFVSGQDAFVSLPTGLGKCSVTSHCLDCQAHSALYLVRSPPSASVLRSFTNDVLQYL